MLIKTLIVVNLLASLKLCTPAVKILPEPLQKKFRPLASLHGRSGKETRLTRKREARLELRVLALFKTIAVFQDERTLEKGHCVTSYNKPTI